jgi:serine protease AprX
MARQITQPTMRLWRRSLTTTVALALGLTGVVATGAAANTVTSTTAGSAAGAPLTDGSLYNVVDQIGARHLWQQGITGRGVNVAVIDTGVAPVDALSGADKVVAMVDLSLEAQVPEAEFRDTYGHGTHMAGIIAGRDPGANPATAASNPQWFMGVAPDAGIVSVKVGDNSGAADVSQVIAGVDWAVDHAAELNIRVINLSYGSGSTLDARTDPLSFAVERAWRAGIVVVVAAGNDGHNQFELGMPAQNPYVIAVAGAERKNGKWQVPSWATSGDGARNPDVAAPGTSIVSLRAPGSRADLEHPEGYVSEHLFKGSGSSQAAAVVSGAAALLLSARPHLTPDQVKGLLNQTASGDVISPRDSRKSGNGLVRVAAAQAAVPPSGVQTWPAADGTGSLEAARGASHVMLNGTVLAGEVTVTGARWTGARWTGARWTAGVWDGARWTGGDWMGARWTGARWTGARWTGATWTGARWTGARWTSDAWSSASWSGARWTGARWTDATWASVEWDGARWTGARWTAMGWADAGWT